MLMIQWLHLVTKLVIVLSCILYFAKRRTGLSLTLLVGAIGNLPLGVVMYVLIYLNAVLRLSSSETMPLGYVLIWAEEFFGAVFAVAIFLVLKRESARPA